MLPRYSVLAKARNICTYPYPHIVIEDALDKDLYNYLAKTRPDVSHNGSNNKRFDIRAKDLLTMDLPTEWYEFIEYHTSREFYEEVSDFFFLPRGSVGVDTETKQIY